VYFGEDGRQVPFTGDEHAVAAFPTVPLPKTSSALVDWGTGLGILAPSVRVGPLRGQVIASA
jgi:hypothetical protein